MVQPTGRLSFWNDPMSPTEVRVRLGVRPPNSSHSESGTRPAAPHRALRACLLPRLADRWIIHARWSLPEKVRGQRAIGKHRDATDKGILTPSALSVADFPRFLKDARFQSTRRGAHVSRSRAVGRQQAISRTSRKVSERDTLQDEVDYFLLAIGTGIVWK